MVTRPMYKNNVSQIERKEKKNTSSPHYIPQCALSPWQKFPIVALPLTMNTLITKTTPPFCLEWQRVRVSSRHFVSAGRASISIFIIIVVIGVVIILECLRCLGRRRGRLHKATKESLLSSNVADMGVHLIQLSRECIKASIHALKLRHDRIQSHTSCWSGRSCRTGPPWMKLRLAPFNEWRQWHT